MDFVHDQLYDGRKIRNLTVIDAFTRYVQALDVRERYTGADVVATLEKVCKVSGYPKWIRGRSSSLKISTCGRMRVASSLTFCGQASRRTTRSSKA